MFPIIHLRSLNRTPEITESRQVIRHPIRTGFATPVLFFVICRSIVDGQFPTCVVAIGQAGLERPNHTISSQPHHSLSSETIHGPAGVCSRPRRNQHQAFRPVRICVDLRSLQQRPIRWPVSLAGLAGRSSHKIRAEVVEIGANCMQTPHSRF